MPAGVKYKTLLQYPYSAVVFIKVKTRGSPVNPVNGISSRGIGLNDILASPM